FTRRPSLSCSRTVAWVVPFPRALRLTRRGWPHGPADPGPDGPGLLILADRQHTGHELVVQPFAEVLPRERDLGGARRQLPVLQAVPEAACVRWLFQQEVASVGPPGCEVARAVIVRPLADELPVLQVGKQPHEPAGDVGAAAAVVFLVQVLPEGSRRGP